MNAIGRWGTMRVTVVDGAVALASENSDSRTLLLLAPEHARVAAQTMLACADHIESGRSKGSGWRRLLGAMKMSGT
jgi:hypothetical protein